MCVCGNFDSRSGYRIPFFSRRALQSIRFQSLLLLSLNAGQKATVSEISDLDTELEKLRVGEQELGLEAASVNLSQDSSKMKPLPGLVRATY
jgi:hypothetical protein